MERPELHVTQGEGKPQIYSVAWYSLSYILFLTPNSCFLFLTYLRLSIPTPTSFLHSKHQLRAHHFMQSVEAVPLSIIHPFAFPSTEFHRPFHYMVTISQPPDISFALNSFVTATNFPTSCSLPSKSPKYVCNNRGDVTGLWGTPSGTPYTVRVARCSCPCFPFPKSSVEQFPTSPGLGVSLRLQQQTLWKPGGCEDAQKWSQRIQFAWHERWWLQQSSLGSS